MKLPRKFTCIAGTTFKGRLAITIIKDCLFPSFTRNVSCLQSLDFDQAFFLKAAIASKHYKPHQQIAFRKVT